MSNETVAQQDTALELRLKRQIDERVEAHYRGHLNDVLAHLEERGEKLVKNLVRTETKDVDAKLAKHLAEVKATLDRFKTSVLDHFRANLETEITNRPIQYN